MPEPTDGHRRMQHEDNMVPLWFEGNYLPEIRIDIDNLMGVDEDSDKDTDESSAELHASMTVNLMMTTSKLC